jgi:CBS domain-containing protein
MIATIALAPVSSIHLRKPARARYETPLIDVVAQMRELRRGATIIDNEAGRIIGIFTERDLVLRIDHSSHRWHQQPVGACMTERPVLLTPNESLATALRRMKEGRFRHLPVVDQQRKAAGILSIRDILVHIIEHYPQEFINLPPDPDHEASRRWGG